MKKIVQKSIVWLAAVAVALGSCAASHAANLSTVMSALSADRGATFAYDSSVEFRKAGSAAIRVNVVESTLRSSFGTNTGNQDSLFTFQRTALNGQNNFAVLAKNQSNTAFASQFDGGTADAFNISSTATSSAAGFQATTRMRGLATQDVASSKIGDPATSDGAPVSNLISLNKDGNSFNFLVRTRTTDIDGQFATGKVNFLGIERLDSGDNSSGFKAFEITSGDDKGAYLISFEKTLADNSKFTFAAVVYGVVNPEPASIAMLGTGVVGLAGLWRRRRNAANAVVAAV